MKIPALVTIAFLLGGCATTPESGSSSAGVLVSHLTQAQVREVAAARAGANGFQVDASMPWILSLSTAQRPYVWTAMLLESGKAPPGYWLLVNDETGQADFVMPALVRSPEPPAGSDWLVKVKEGMRRVKYPIRIEEFLRQANATGIESDGGGTMTDGRMFLDYTLRREKDSPARFELRCYITTPDGWPGPKIVTSAELSYTDAKVNRYLLLDGND